MAQEASLEQLARAYAEEKGVSLEEAMRIVKELFGDRPDTRSELLKLAEELGSLADTLQKLPPESREVLTRAFIEARLRGGDDDFWHEAKRLMLLKFILEDLERTRTRQPPVELVLLQRELDSLKSEIASLKQALLQQQRNPLEERIASLEKRLEDLKKTIAEAAASRTEAVQVREKSLIEQVKELEEQLNALRKLDQLLNSLGGKEYVARIEEKKVDAWSEAMTKHIIPAVAELIRNPDRLKALAGLLRRSAEGEAGQTGQAQTVEQPPSLEKYLEEVEGSG